MKHSRPRNLHSLPTTPSRGDLVHVLRFDGIHKSSQPWDALRRDDELWQEDGNCLVHLYAPGMSRRGPSLKVPLDMVEQSNCPYLFVDCITRPEPPSPSSVCSDDNSDSGYGGSVAGDKPPRLCELHVPAPLELTRQEVFLYHVGTRNYFAYLLNKPLVGEHLGSALAELAARIESWQPEDVSSTGFLDYCQSQGYLDYAERIDYAVASLYLADQARIRDMWVEAFAHCVGMSNRLERAPETERLSKTTRALISCAALRMELHVERTRASLGGFLEYELGPEVLGLSRPLRKHMDRFRSFLHAHYVNEMGYYPSDPSSPWDKRTWNSMYEDFSSVYAYLADTQSSHDLASNRGLSGGICVAQNIAAFDTRYNCPPLPHPLPLEPQMPLARHASDAQKKTLRSFRLTRSDTVGGGGSTNGGGNSSASNVATTKQALARASNTSNPDLLNNRLVQAFVRFERLSPEEKVSMVEARKVRWILVYGVLQMLISITCAPPEVLDTHTPSYPLCLDASVRPSWWLSDMGRIPPLRPQPRHASDTDDQPGSHEDDRLSIHPDCQADSAEDFFSLNTLTRTGSDVSMALGRSPARSSPQMSRSASIRSSVNSLHHSIAGSFTRRRSQRRSSMQVLSRMPSFCDTVPEGGQQPSFGDSLMDCNSGPVSPLEPAEWEPVLESDVIPTLELHQLTTSADRHPHLRRRPTLPDKSERRTPPSANPPTDPHDLSAFHFGFSPSSTATTSTYQATRASDTNTTSYGGSLHAGCYLPTGAHSYSQNAPTFKERTLSTASALSILSAASSNYPEISQQAAEIEEEETRGRIRIRRLGGGGGSVCADADAYAGLAVA